jgi:tryptophan synthase alpha chain
VTPRGRVAQVFDDLRTRGARGLIPFVVGGHPSVQRTTETLLAIDRAGADIIEIGLPFSDPIADGPVIADAMHRALNAGVMLRSLFAATREARADLAAPLVAMTSVSLAHRVGLERFMGDLADAGFDGVIVPDAPLEETPPIAHAAAAAGLTASPLVAPTTPPQRAAQIARHANGFIYLLARAGVTGERDTAPTDGLADRIAAIRAHTDLPIACGFGISRPEHAHAVTRHADAAIVGSALVRRMNSDDQNEPARFIAELRAAIDA